MKKNSIVLDIQEVTVSFDGFKALNSLSLEVKKNEMIAIIGPNGAGKTTLQDVITGKTKIDNGKIFFKNNDLSQFAEHEIANLGIGRKFQRPTVIENISVWNNLNIALKTNKSFMSSLFYKLTSENRDRIESIIKTIDLEKKKHSIALMIDQRVSEGERIDFFDEPALTTSLPAQLSIKFNLDIIPVLIERNKDDNFVIEFQNKIRPDTFKNKIDLTIALNKILEKMIIKNPEQWIWTHNRWK